MICTRRHVRLTLDAPIAQTFIVRPEIEANAHGGVLDVAGRFTDDDVKLVIAAMETLESNLILIVHRETIKSSYKLPISNVDIRGIAALHDKFDWSPNRESAVRLVSTGWIDVFCDRIYVTLNGESTIEDAWKQVVKLIGYTRDLDRAIHRYQCEVFIQILPADLVACVFGFV